jgi:hypothetical protein
MKISRHLLAGFTALSAMFVGSTLLPHEASAQEVRIVLAPPPPRVEVITVRPGPYHVWRPGVWVWHVEGRYVWHPGHWDVPPPGKSIWVRDEWVSYGGSWRFVPGHWRAVGEHIPSAIQRVVVAAAPPPPPVETIAVAPAGQAWIHGHWSWDGLQFVWVPGHFMAVPVGFTIWEPGHWFASGPHWFYASGYWR